MNWRALSVSVCGTHHLSGDAPAYFERFDEVLKFHHPGLAPVMRDGLAWHIHPDGSDAYLDRFVRTFGFYEGRAAVQTNDGWCHIHPDGHEVYTERYDWCGNFQSGRATVRLRGGRYRHIRMDGSPVSHDRWRYAGDYKDGCCVVQNDAGNSTHLDLHGEQVHGKWYADLDVFHKGFARARDAGGWMHVDPAGIPVYQRRFAAVEPFYNGQSRVERFDGGLEVIDERGNQIVELRSTSSSDFAALSADMVGFWRTQTIAASVRLGVIEALPGSAADIAERVGLSGDGALRLLRALGELQIVENDRGSWQLSSRGVFLLRSHPLTLVDAALEYSGELGALWVSLPQALTLGGGWKHPEIFNDVAKDAERLSGHHRMLNSYALHDYARIPAVLDLRGDESIIDAGGGVGAFADYLLETFPRLTVTVLDKPEVVAKAQEGRGASTRLKWLAGDLFGSWGRSADVVTMTRVLHDWDDVDAIAILCRARQVLPTGGRLFVIEMLLSESDYSGALCDLHLLMVTGGRERSKSAFEKLFRKAGFELLETRQVAALPSVLCAVAV